MTEATPLPRRAGARRPDNGSILNHQATPAAPEAGGRRSTGGRPALVEVTTRAPSGRPSYAGRSMSVYFASDDDKELVHAIAKYASATGHADSTQEWITTALLGAAETIARNAPGGIFDDRLAQRDKNRQRQA